ncbi:MAG TPA: ABC transporter substrate-binding protein [Roseiarcus sp.]|nr:ABC transporter substrate-binding protein [Roseiarcus sp.]
MRIGVDYGASSWLTEELSKSHGVAGVRTGAAGRGQHQWTAVASELGGNIMKVGLNRRMFVRMVGVAGCAGIVLVSATALTYAAPPMQIGISIPTLDNPFWVNAIKFAQHAAKELNVELTVVGADNREDKQLADVQSLLSSGAQALVVTPQSTASAPGLIKLADRAHVPIVIVDRYPGFEPNNSEAPYVAFIGPNDVTAGSDIAKYLISQGAKKMVAIGGLPGSSVAEGREKGLRQAIAGASGVELVQYVSGGGESEDHGYQTMQNLLSAHPSGTIDSVWCYNDALCLGAFRAIKQAGRDGEIKLGGMDLVPQALDLIDRKTNYVYSTGGHWLQVGFGIMIAYDKVNGHNPIKDNIRLDLLGVNSSNFATFKHQFIDNAPPYDVKEYTLTNNPSAKSQTFPLATK